MSLVYLDNGETSVSTLSFPDTVVGDTATKFLVINGSAGETLNQLGLSSVSAGPSPFSLLSSNCTDAERVNSTFCWMEIGFTPGADRGYAGGYNLTFGATGVNLTNPQLPLQGTGIAAVPVLELVDDSDAAVTTLAFPGTATGGGSSSITVTLKNTGNSPAQLLEGIAQASPPFSVTASTCSTTLPASEQCSITVAFTPTQQQEYSGSSFTLQVLVSNASAPSVTLSGTGEVPSLSVLQVSAGFNHNCAVTTSGTVKCWGNTAYGKLGNGIDSFSTNIFTPAAVPGLSSVRSVHTAGRVGHSCAVLTSGEVKCWGSNSRGQLGDGTQTNRLTPVSVVGLGGPVQSLAMSTMSTCALLTTGKVQCWGAKEYNYSQMLTSADVRVFPVDVAGVTAGVAAIQGGASHFCALMSSGGVKCWGDNSALYLGSGSASQPTGAVDVSGLTSGVASIAVGDLHSCARLNTGAVKCWGNNEAGSVGDGTLVNKSTPVFVSSLSSVQSLVAGGMHTCAKLGTGQTMCWGSNYLGELGDGTQNTSAVPVLSTVFPAGYSGLSLGSSRACLINDAGKLMCWGALTGNGTGGIYLTPQYVLP